jgi:hypothetical protein
MESVVAHTVSKLEPMLWQDVSKVKYLEIRKDRVIILLDFKQILLVRLSQKSLHQYDVQVIDTQQTARAQIAIVTNIYFDQRSG